MVNCQIHALSMNPVLIALLEPLKVFLDLKDLVEISVLKECEIALEIQGQGYVYVSAPELDFSYWNSLCHTLANMNGLIFDIENNPILSTRLPDLSGKKFHRFEAMLGPFVEQGISISIRMSRETKRSLEDFGLSGKVKEQVLSTVRLGSAILISGGTSSGKTTLLNLLVQEIPLEKRILTIEDTRELNLPHKNWKAYTIPRNDSATSISYKAIIDHFMRSRPDIVITGEVSIPNSFPILRLLNTGHKGFMCTIHANSPLLALEEAFEQNLRLGGHPVINANQFLKKTIDLVIQVDQVGVDRREITALWKPQENDFMSLSGDMKFKEVP